MSDRHSVAHEFERHRVEAREILKSLSRLSQANIEMIRAARAAIDGSRRLLLGQKSGEDGSSAPQDASKAET